MRVLLVSIDLEYSLTYAYLRAFAAADGRLAGELNISVLELDPMRLGVYVDKNLESYRLLERIERDPPDLVCFSCYLWNHLAIRELIRLLKRVYPHLLILVGGPEVLTPAAAEDFLNHAPADFVVRGEGEITFAELCRRLIEGGDPADIAGLTLHRGGAPAHAPERPKLRGLDRIPSPVLTGTIDLGLFDKVDDDGGVDSRRYRRYLMETYRGCYMVCSYCQWGDGVAFRARFSVQRICDELDLIIAHRLQLVNFVDAMFGFSISGAKKILRSIIESKRRHGAGTVFVGYHNQDFFDEELFALYREAGFYPEIDLQSTNQAVLDLLGRGKWPPECFEKHRRAFRRHGVVMHDSSDLIIGLPGDSYDSLRQSVDYFLERGIRVHLFHASALPGTRMWSEAEQHGLVFNAEPPRFVVRTATMPVSDVVRARLLGHGAELFQQFPNTMALALHCAPEFGKPSEVCEAFGQWLSERGDLAYEMGQYNRDYNLIGYQSLARQFLVEVSADWDERSRDILLALHRFESERRNSRQFGREPPASPGASVPEHLSDLILSVAPTVALVDFDYLVTAILGPDRLVPLGIPTDSPVRDPDVVPARAVTICFYRGLPGYEVLRRTTGAVLRRCNGYFTLRECLENHRRQPAVSLGDCDLDSLRTDLERLCAIGVVSAQQRHRAL